MIKGVYLDRGFCSVPIIRFLQTEKIAAMIPMVVRGKTKGTRQFMNATHSYQTVYTMNSCNHGPVTFTLRVICVYIRNREGKRVKKVFLYFVYGLNTPLRFTYEEYRQRFGIESSYRMKNIARIKTSTKNAVIRLLFVSISFLLINLWVYILWAYVSKPRKGSRLVYHKLFPLKRALYFLRSAVERFFPLKYEIVLSKN